MTGQGRLPLAGGMFLGDDADESTLPAFSPEPPSTFPAASRSGFAWSTEAAEALISN